MPWRDREKYNAWLRENRWRYAEKEAAWKEENKDHRREQQRISAGRRRLKQREDMLDIIGRACARCGLEDTRVLQFHHANGGGNQHRREITGTAKSGSPSYYASLLGMHNHTRGSVVSLCANCHILAELELQQRQEYPEPPRKRREYLRGVNHPQSKLTMSMLTQANARRASGESYKAMAREFGVCTSTLIRALKREGVR